MAGGTKASNKNINVNGSMLTGTARDRRLQERQGNRNASTPSQANLTDKEIEAVNNVVAKINQLRNKVKTGSAKMSLGQINKNTREYQKQLDRLIKFAERKGYQTPKQDGITDYSTIKPSLGQFLGVDFVM